MSELKAQPIIKPDIYREMAEPFETVDAANDAINAFFEDLSALRERHKLAEVYVIIRDSMRDDPEAEEQTFYVTLHRGDSSHSESMVAYAMGLERERREKMLTELMSGKGYKSKRGK